MEQKQPKRRPNRLKEYNYSDIGAYFITVCTEKRKNYFWQAVGATIGRLQEYRLTALGEYAKTAIQQIGKIYPAVEVEYAVVMPNHIHLLLLIRADENGRPMTAPTVSRVINQLKGAISKEAGYPVWQKGFYDHVIRNERDHDEIARYICDNPANWMNDEYHSLL